MNGNPRTSRPILYLAKRDRVAQYIYQPRRTLNFHGRERNASTDEVFYNPQNKELSML